MSGRRYDREPPYENYRGQHRRPYDDWAHQENQRGPYPKDRHARSPSPRRPYTPPQDQYKDQDSGELKIKGASTQREREPRDARERRNSDRDYDDYRRDRSRSPRGDFRRPYRDRDREGYRSPSYDSRERSRGRGRYASRSRSRSYGRHRERSPYYGGPPSREVILEGLLPDMGEEDISKELLQNHNVEHLDDVRVIRNRQTKVSRCFGFIRFPSLELSTAFVERNFPAIYIKANDPSSRNDEPTKVRLAYSRERSDKGEKEMDAGEWACRTCGFHNFSGRTKCRSCGQSPFDPSMYASILARNPYVNSGDSDVAPDGSPSQFLIIRGLEASVTEDLLAKGVSKLYKPTSAHSVPTSSAKKDHSKVLSTTGDSNLGAKEDTLRRVLLIRDRRTNESWRYGFAEFATIEDAQAALIRYSSFNRFTISSKPVTADYIHAGVFVPDLNATEATSRFTFSPTGNSATRFRYWDEQVYVSELVVSTTSAVDKTSGSRVRSVQDESSATMGSSKGGKDAENRAKRRKFDTKDSTKQKAAGSSQLQFWSDRHAELHGSKQPSAGRQDSNALDLSMSQVDSSSGTLPANSFLDPRTHVCFLCWERPRNEKNYREHPMTEKHQKNLMDKALVQKAEVLQARSPKTSYIDIARKFCYLCHTHYPSEVRVVQHELLQDSHQENLKDETTIERAKKEMSKPKCIDWDRLLCLLCLEQYYDELSLIGHEIADAKHQEMLKREGCVELAKANLANPNSFADRQRQVCYLCLQKFENVACLSLHEVMSENHKAKSKDLEACAKAKAQVAKQSYADAIGKYCYLCKRDFETEPELIRHEIMDADHNQSLLNAGIVKIAKAKLKDNGIPIKKIIKAVPDAEYRDRAKERRQAFGKTKKISFTPKKVDREPEEDRDEGKAPGSKGASLLNKMGWKAGEGLGAQGTGMTVPIETNLYAAGVGLGAEGGNVGGATEEAERNTKSDYRAFLERTKDKAKERYEKMA